MFRAPHRRHRWRATIDGDSRGMQDAENLEGSSGVRWNSNLCTKPELGSAKKILPTIGCKRDGRVELSGAVGLCLPLRRGIQRRRLLRFGRGVPSASHPTPALNAMNKVITRLTHRQWRIYVGRAQSFRSGNRSLLRRIIPCAFGSGFRVGVEGIKATSGGFRRFTRIVQRKSLPDRQAGA